MDDTTHLIFEKLGNEKPIRDLVDAFYSEIEKDPLLRPMYPGKDLGPAKERLALFLIQRLGGHSTYSDKRGHPRLRMRHAPFLIGREEKDSWMRNMTNALDAVPALAPYRDALLQYFEESAEFLINKPDYLKFEK